MRKLKQSAVFIAAAMLAIIFVLWYSDYNSDKVRVSFIDKDYTYQNEAEVTGGKADINTASVQTLALIDGIGEKTAQAIVDYREAHGDFGDISEICNVKGIGNKTYEKIKDYICVN